MGIKVFWITDPETSLPVLTAVRQAADGFRMTKCGCSKITRELIPLFPRREKTFPYGKVKI